MKKLILAIAILLGSLITTTIYAQKVDKIDPVAAIAKGIVTSPTPGILAFISENNLQTTYDQIKDDVNWYMYKGLIYARYDTGFGMLVVVFTPKGDVLAAFLSGSQIYPTQPS